MISVPSMVSGSHWITFTAQVIYCGFLLRAQAAAASRTSIDVVAVLPLLQNLTNTLKATSACGPQPQKSHRYPFHMVARLSLSGQSPVCIGVISQPARSCTVTTSTARLSTVAKLASSVSVRKCVVHCCANNGDSNVVTHILPMLCVSSVLTGPTAVCQWKVRTRSTAKLFEVVCYARPQGMSHTLKKMRGHGADRLGTRHPAVTTRSARARLVRGRLCCIVTALIAACASLSCLGAKLSCVLLTVCTGQPR